MPPAALHQSANALACWTNSTSSPGSMVLAASLNTAILMVFAPTPRTEEAPPDPGSQIFPTPGQTPLLAEVEDNVRLSDVAAAAAPDENATYVPATIVTAAIASGSTDLRSSASPLKNILTPSPERFAFVSFNNRVIQSVPRREEASGLRGSRAKIHWYR